MTERSSQRPCLVERLLDPALYPHPVDRVKLIETHISWVLLAGDRVYKIKKPVNLGFLDFTTLALRRRFCQDEVRLNRRLASDVYLGVVEIKGSAGAPRFEGRGRTREVAVVMRRLPAERMLDRLVREKAAPAALLDGIGRTVARFHAAADTGGEIDELGGIETIRASRRGSPPGAAATATGTCRLSTSAAWSPCRSSTASSSSRTSYARVDP